MAPDLIVLGFVSVADAATGFALVTAVLGYILSVSWRRCRVALVTARSGGAAQR